MTIKDGKVVVIRDGDYVEGVFYREFYSSIDDFLDEVNMFLSVKNYDNPNISFMEIKDGKFACLDDCDFLNEFSFAKEYFGITSKAFCEQCKNANFIYLNSSDTYCPSCKKKR